MEDSFKIETKRLVSGRRGGGFMAVLQEARAAEFSWLPDCW